jgi:hypothetical protein
MVEKPQEKILLNAAPVTAHPVVVQPASTDIVMTRLSHDISPGAFSNDSLIAGTVRAIPPDVFGDLPASQTSPELAIPTSLDDSSRTAMRFADAFRIGAAGDESARKIESIFPILRKVADHEQMSSAPSAVDGLASIQDEPRDDADAAERIARLRTALFGSA